MRKPIKYFTIVFLSLMITVVVGLAACSCKQSKSSSNGSSSSTIDATLKGFTVEERITVQAGMKIKVAVPSVTDAYGAVDVYYDVTDIEGKYVEVSYDEFFALDGDGYTITYKVLDAKGEEHTLQTQVVVEGNINLVADYDPLVSVGDTVAITPVCTYDDPTYGFEVAYEDGSAVEVKDQSFACRKVGTYTVTVTATDGDRGGEYSYEVYARKAARVGEVEAIGKDWETIRAAQNRSTDGWKLTDTATSGVKDRFGGSSDFISLTMTEETMTARHGSGAFFHLNPRFDYKYYKALAEEGYEYVSVWVYADAETAHRAYLCTPTLSTAYTLEPRQWNEIRVHLLKESETDSAAFVKFCNEYVENNSEFLFFENYEYNGHVKELGITMYIGGIYLVNPSEQVQLIDVNENTSVDLASVPIYGELEGLEEQYSRIEWRLTPQYASSADETVTINGSTLDDAQKFDGVYNTVAFLDGKTVWAGQIDFYNSADGVVWNNAMTDTKYAVVREDKSRENHSLFVRSIEAVTNPAGAPKGNYYKFNWTGTGTVFGVLPIHSVSYYAMYQGKGYALQFTYYTDYASGEGDLMVRYFAKNSQKYITKGAWTTVDYNSVEGHTSNYKIETIVKNWDSLVSTSSTGESSTGLIELWNGATNQILYLGNISIKHISVTGEDTLVNVATVSTAYDLTNTLSESNKELLDTYAEEGTLVWKLCKTYDRTGETLASCVINPANYEKRAYTLTAELNGELVYTAQIDFYDPADGIVWNNMTDENLAFMSSHRVHASNQDGATLNNASTALLSSESGSLPSGAPKGNYYRYTFSGSATIIHILPMHTKAYYEQYTGQGFAFKFYMYNAASTRCRYFNTDKQPYTLTMNTWIEMGYGFNGGNEQYTLDEMVKNWSALSSTASLGDNASGLFTMWDGLIDVTLYVGEVVFSLIPYDDGTILVDTKAITEYDLFANASKSAQEGLNLYTTNAGALTWKLTTLYSEKQTVFSKSTVTLATIENRAYNVTAEVNGQIVYTACVDFYNSEAGIVWNDITDTDLAIMRSNYHHTTNGDWSNPIVSLTNASTSIVSDTAAGVPANAPKGNYYKYTFTGSATVIQMLPIHTLNYYKLYEGQNYVFNFAVYNEADTRCRYFTEESQSYTLTMDTWLTDMGYGFNGKTAYTLDHLISHWTALTSLSLSGTANGGLFTVWDKMTDKTVYVGALRFTKLATEN